MVYPDVEFPLVEFLDRRVNVVSAGVTRNVWKRVKVDHLLRGRVDQAWRDNVASIAGKLASIGIDGGGNSGIIALESVSSSIRPRRVRVKERGHASKVARPHLGRGYQAAKKGFALPRPFALIVNEEESLVFDDGTAERSSKLVLYEFLFLRREKALGVQR